MLIRRTTIGAVFLSFVLSLLTVFNPQTSFAQTANVQQAVTLQVIHASADPALSSVSLWAGQSASFTQLIANGGLGSASSVQTSLGSAIPSLNVAVNVPLQVNIAAANSASATPAQASLPFAMGRGSNIVIAAGVLRPRNFAANPAQNFTDMRLIHIIDTVTTSTTDNVRLLFVHAATDAQRVDVVVRQTGAVLASLNYAQSGFATVPVGDYTIDVRFSTSQSIIASFAAPLQSLNFGGQRVTCVLTGFLNPKTNQDGQALGMVAAPSVPVFVDSVTSVASVMLPIVDKPFVAPNPTTTVQIIDNSADANRLPLNTILQARTANATTTTVAPIGQALRFREASRTVSTTAVTTFVVVNMMRVPVQSVITLDNVIGSQITALTVRQRPLPGRPIIIDPASFPQTTLARGANTIIATGVIDTTDYAKNPDGLSTRTKFTRFVDEFDSVATDSIRLLLFQGVTDAKQLDISIRGGDSIASLKYAEGRFITLPAQQFTFDFTTFGSSDVIGSFSVPLQDYAGRRISVMTSGFVNGAKNSNGQPLALMLVPEQPSTTDRITLLQAAPAPAGVAETTLQVLQASADMGLNPVGVALRLPVANTNGVFLPVTRSLPFRQADTAVTGLGAFAPFLKDIAGINLTAFLTRANAASAVSALYQQNNFSLVRGANIVFVSGFQRPSLFAPNPDNLATNIGMYQFVDRVRTVPPDSVRLLVFHSVSDAPRVDRVARGAAVNGTNVTRATLRDGQGAWVTVPSADDTLDIVPTGKSSVLASYSAPLHNLGMGGQRVSIAATGVLNPAQNQWFPPLGLYAASNSSSIGIIGTTTTTLTTSIDPLPSASAITVTGTTITTTAIAVSTTANGETTTTITIAENIFTPNPASSGIKPGAPAFPTKPTTIVTTTTTVTATLTSSMKMDVTTTTVSLLNGSSTTTTTATTIWFATTSSLTLSMMLPAVPSPLGSSVNISGKADAEESITASVFPNPAQETTTISYTMKSDEIVGISLFDVYGQLVSTLETTNMKSAGRYALELNTQTLQSGVYEARILTQSRTKTVKVVVIR